MKNARRRAPGRERLEELGPVRAGAVEDDDAAPRRAERRELVSHGDDRAVGDGDENDGGAGNRRPDSRRCHSAHPAGQGGGGLRAAGGDDDAKPAGAPRVRHRAREAARPDDGDDGALRPHALDRSACASAAKSSGRGAWSEIGFPETGCRNSSEAA